MDKAKDESFKERLTSVVETSGKSRAAFARAIGVGDTTLKNYMTGETEPGVTELLAICREGKCSLLWLVANEGSRTPNAVGEDRPVYNVDSDSYRKEFIYEVVAALNGVMHRGGKVMTAERHAKMVIALLYLFRSVQKVEVEAIERMLDATELGSLP